MKTTFIIESLIQWYQEKNERRQQWCWFEELRIGTGYSKKHAEQRIDLYVLNLWPSKDYQAISYEVKISRADFLKEIRSPLKRYPAMMVSNEFYFVAPVGLIKEDELPEYCGLVEVSDSGEIRVVKGAINRPKLNPDWGFLASIGRRVTKSD